MGIRRWGDIDFDEEQSLIVDVTPELAKEALKRNFADNRKIKPSVVKNYARLMSSGDFKGLASDPIKFTKGGAMINGQHRMQAVLVSGTTQRFIVATGFDDEDYRYIDQGKNRDLSDLVSFDVANASQLMAILKVAYRLEQGDAIRTSLRPDLDNKQAFITWANENYEDYVDCYKMCTKMRSATERGSLRAYAAALIVMGRTLDPTLPERFAEYFASSDEPGAYRIRDYIKSQILKSKRHPDPAWQTGTLLIAAEAFHREGALRKKAPYNNQEAAIERFNSILKEMRQ